MDRRNKSGDDEVIVLFAQNAGRDGGMKTKTTKSKKHKPGMLAAKPSKGLERDNRGGAIPMAKRLPEDRAKAKKASRKTARRGT